MNHMKTYLLKKAITILLFLASTNFSTFSQDLDYPIYVHELIIGGAACDIHIQSAELTPRATKDIDMILMVKIGIKEQDALAKYRNVPCCQVF